MKELILSIAFSVSMIACGDSSNDEGGGGGGNEPSGGGAAAGGASATGYSACGGSIVKPDGSVDAAEYAKQARLWDAATIDCRLGPKYDAYDHAGEVAPPTAWERDHTPNEGGYLCKSYELSGSCATNCDYGSTSGQVLFAPSDAAQPGVDRAQTYAYENGTICQSPQQGGWLGGPHPDPALTQWQGELGRPVLLPNAFHQTELYQTNGGILTFPDGLVGATGNQTSGGSNPRAMLPENKVPTAVAVTGYNELALVTVWDTDTLQGQVAVFALRADSPPAFSVPYFALPNEAGFKNLHLMGYIDLPDMQTPTSVAALGNNGSTPGGKAIGNDFASSNDPSKNIATSEAARAAFARDDYERWVASSGQAVVASRWENKLTFIDLQPLFQFVRAQYFTDQASFDAAASQTSWAFTFETNPEARPVVVTTLDVEAPTAMRVGNMLQGFAEGLELSLHAFVATESGSVHVYDISAFSLEAPRPIASGSVTEIATLQAGRNITSMRSIGHPNASVIVVSRGDRVVQWLGIDGDTFAVRRELRDSRMLDPVVVDANDRGPIVTVGDFSAGKLLNYRVGATEDNGNKPPANYGCGPDGTDASCESPEFGGELDFDGSVFYIGTSNVN
jgi:hypothetical protein